MGKPASTVRGHTYERDVVKELKSRGWDAATSRYASRRLDDQGIDITSDDFPYHIQCKATVITPSIHDLLTTTAANVIFWRRIVKRRIEKKGNQFFKDGEYVVISQEDFLDLVQRAYKNKDK